MKILEIVRSFYPTIGGLEKFVQDRLMLYNEIEFDYELITTEKWINKKKVSHYQSNINRIWQFSPYNITPYLGKYLSRKFHIISVHEVGRYFSDYAIRWGRKNGVPTVVTPHYFYHTQNYKLIKELVSNFIVRNTLRFATKIICFTETEKEFWCNFDREIINKIIIIPHFYRTLPIYEEDIKDDGYLLYIGRYDENKKIELLLNSFLSLQSTQMKLFLTLDINQLPSRFGRFKNNTNIKFLGYVSESQKTELLKNCTALILPSDYEAFGITLLEASNYYKPLLASNLSVFNEIHNHAGVMYFGNNLESLSLALVRLNKLSSDEKLNMGRINFKNLKRYSFNEISRKYKTLYESLIT